MSNPSETGAPYNALLPIQPPPIVEGLWYHDQIITLDGYIFRNCRFDRCNLVLNTSQFEMQHCHLDEISTLTVAGSIVKPIQIFNRNMRWMRESNSFFMPTLNPDGTISISTIPNPLG